MSKRKIVGDTGTSASRSLSTMSDVARLAGVSVMTVSRVVNSKHPVSANTRQKVARAAASLHYAPSRAARGLAGYRPIRIGFLYSNPSATYLNELLVGLLNQSGLNNVQLLVEKCEAGSEEQALARCLFERGLDGMILPPPLGENKTLVAHAKGHGIPVVAVACGLSDPALGTVSVDDCLAACAMTRHLISLGHRRIGFLAGDPNQIASGRRLAGYHRALRECGADTSEELVAQGWFTYRSGLDAAEQLLALSERPTAIFASNDDMAAAAVAAAQRIGLDVPGDLTVTGFDDSALATKVWPELTTIRQPIAEMAREGVEMIVRQIRAQQMGEAAMPEHIRLGWELVRRQSDAVPRMRPPSPARFDIRPLPRSPANSDVTHGETRPVRLAPRPA